MMKYGCPSARLAEVEDLDDVLVRDHVDRARLVEEAGDDVGIARQHGVQQLDRHLAAEDRVLGEIDDAHSALAQKARDPVVPDRVVNQRGSGGHDRGSPQPRRGGAENLKILRPREAILRPDGKAKCQMFPAAEHPSSPPASELEFRNDSSRRCRSRWEKTEPVI